MVALWVRSSLPHYPETVDEIEEEKEAATSFFWILKNEIAQYAKQYDVEIHEDTQSGHAAKTIVDYAQEHGVDLIVLGHTGHSGLWGKFLGHTPDKVTENAHCSVLIVR
jgi:nucleotide-binding universal stress UspA family protein